MIPEAIETDIRLLLIDDEEVIRKSAGKFLEGMGYTVLYADSAEKGLGIFEEDKVDIVISDIKMPGMDGVELLQELAKRSQDTEVILITGHGNQDTAIEALRHGAFDYFRKPIKVEELLGSLQRTRKYQEVRRERDRIQQRLDALLRAGSGPPGRHEIVGESRPMQEAMALVDKVASSDRTTVLIEGESGTGKELIARAIHERSPRSSKPFISVNSTAIAETLLESELFGHEKGAFTDAHESRKGVFELAEGGTLFLDEIGDMSLSAQAKILRVLEERSIRRVGGSKEIDVDVRLISATNQDLQSLIANREFRQDLFFRLNVFAIELSPLRDRGDDALLLAYGFLKEYGQELKKDIAHIDPSAEALLRQYSFPGNVRELRNLIERAVILCEGTSLSEWDLPDLTSKNGSAQIELSPTSTPLSLAKLEEQAIQAALRRAGGNQNEAAKDLGIGQDALRYRLKKYGIGSASSEDPPA